MNIGNPICQVNSKDAYAPTNPPFEAILCRQKKDSSQFAPDPLLLGCTVFVEP